MMGLGFGGAKSAEEESAAIRERQYRRRALSMRVRIEEIIEHVQSDGDKYSKSDLLRDLRSLVSM